MTRVALESELLHCVARVALRVQPPLRAKRIVDRVGRWLRPFGSIAEAGEAARTLERRGSCLSQALAISARLPGSEVVLAAGTGVASAKGFWAHAWVERDGVPVGREAFARGGELARLK